METGPVGTAVPSISVDPLIRTSSVFEPSVI